MSRQQLALGTAQIGFSYGVTNAHGKLDDTIVQELLEVCRAQGIRLLDTANGYGDSEQRLGAALRAAGTAGWQVITKTPAVAGDRIDATVLGSFTQAWRTSVQRLAPLRIHGLLLHAADDLLKPGGEALYGWLQERRSAGEVAQVGVSVYEVSQLEALLSRYGSGRRAFDIVQLPASIADQRLAGHPVLRDLKQRGIEIHVRSLFLQGLLLAPDANASFAGPQANEWLRRFHANLARASLTPLQACLSFFRSIPEFDVAVVGATSASELTQIAQAFAIAQSRPWQDWRAEGDWIDPRRWRKQ